MKRRKGNSNSLWHDAWRRLLKNRAAVIGMCWMAGCRKRSISFTSAGMLR